MVLSEIAHDTGPIILTLVEISRQGLAAALWENRREGSGVGR